MSDSQKVTAEDVAWFRDDSATSFVNVTHRKNILAALAALTAPPASEQREGFKCVACANAPERFLDLRGDGYCAECLVAILSDPAPSVHEDSHSAAAMEVARLYHELLYAVEYKVPGESRHGTALRLIRDAQRSTSSDAAQSGRETK